MGTSIYISEKEQSIAEFFTHQNGNTMHCFAVFGIDNFAMVNEVFGEAKADELLIDIENHISSVLRGSDIVCKLNGDEFGILIKNPGSLVNIENLAQKILQEISKTTYEYGFLISATMGISIYPFHGSSYEELNMRAYQAMIWGKANGKDNYRIFDAANTKAKFADFLINNKVEDDYDAVINGGDKWIETFIDTCFSIVYHDPNPQSAVNAILEIFCLHYGFSRACFTMEYDDVHEVTNKCFFALPGFEYTGVDISKRIQIVKDVFDKFGSIAIFNNENEENSVINDYMTSKNIDEMLVYTMKYRDGVIGGCIFENCQNVSTEINIDELMEINKALNIIKSYVFVLFDKRNPKEYLAKLSLLNSMGSFNYVVDADTHTIEFINRKGLEIVDSSVIGSKCYEAVRGMTIPCIDCPLKSMDIDDPNANAKATGINMNTKRLTIDLYSWISGHYNKGKALVASIDFDDIFDIIDEQNV